jgi:Domain of unknown function (DUF4390)
MKRPLLFVSIMLAIMVITGTPVPSRAQEITGPEARMVNGDIYVSFSMKLDEKRLQEIRDGMDKELKFYVDLFRVWNVWPDEFVVGKLITKTLKSDPIKGEYVGTSFDGSTFIQKRFKSCDSMFAWTFIFKDLKLTNTRELPPGMYFVRITVESKIRKLPPVIGPFMIFISENEFKIKKDSASFAAGEGGK